MDFFDNSSLSSHEDVKVLVLLHGRGGIHTIKYVYIDQKEHSYVRTYVSTMRRTRTKYVPHMGLGLGMTRGGSEEPSCHSLLSYT